MVKNSKEHRRDPHYKSAKQEGYRARSAFKLLEIQKRFNIFKRAFYILDLGCAPGSWLQVAKKFSEENLEKYNDQYYHRDHYKIMGVDTKKTTPIEKVKLIQDDFTKPKFIDEIDGFFPEKLDLILSDASINKSGNKFSDQIRQINLCLKIIDLTKRRLKINGSLVIKVFQGNDFNNFYEKVKKEFKYLKSYKPKSSKKTSNEIYLIGLQKI
ncbi:MAG: SAM-dependent methyltransferase [Candidatus Hodarchaeota archaeon]